MHAFIVGGGSVGYHLAEILRRIGHVVTVVERQPSRATLIRPDLERMGIRVAEGDAADPKVLEAANIGSADAVVAVTNEDEDNLVVCTLAKFEFHVPRVIVRVNDPRHLWMFRSDMGVDVAVNQAELMARLLEEEVAPEELVPLLRLREGRIALVEKAVPSGSRTAGRRLADQPLPREAVCVAIIRGVQVFCPSPDVVVQPDDRLLFLVPVEQEDALAAALA